MSADTLRELLIIAVLIALNAVFVAAEIALVTVRRSRLDQLAREGSASARRAREVVADPARFLAVIQLGITFIGFLASAYAAVSLTLALERTFDKIELVAPYSEALALVIVTAVLSIVTIIFGELVPKSFALRNTERFALLLAGPIDIIGRVLAPIIWFLTKATNVVTRGVGGTREEDTVLGSEELRLLVEQSREQGAIEAEESQMIGAIFDLGGRRVHLAVPARAPAGPGRQGRLRSAAQRCIGGRRHLPAAGRPRQHDPPRRAAGRHPDAQAARAAAGRRAACDRAVPRAGILIPGDVRDPRPTVHAAHQSDCEARAAR